MFKLQHSIYERKFFKIAKYFTEDVNMIQISQGYADQWLHSLSQTCHISIHEFQLPLMQQFFHVCCWNKTYFSQQALLLSSILSEHNMDYKREFNI